MKKIGFFIILIFVAVSSVRAELPLGEIPQTIILENENGGRLDGGLWNSEEMRGRVHIMFYIDPEEADLNRHVEFALDKTCLLLKVPVFAIINTAAAWYPNSMIRSEIEKRKKWAHNTTFVLDKNKALVKKWNLKDDTYDVLVFDADGTVIFCKEGELSTKEVKKMINVVAQALYSSDMCKNRQLTNTEINDLIRIIQTTRKIPFGWCNCYKEFTQNDGEN